MTTECFLTLFSESKTNFLYKLVKLCKHLVSEIEDYMHIAEWRSGGKTRLELK